MPNQDRRTFLKQTLTTGTMGVAWAGGFLVPDALLAAWPKEVFSAKDVPTVLKNLYGTEVVADSAAIQIKAPEIAENGAVVPISIETSLDNVTQIAIFAAVNPLPLAADFRLTDSMLPSISTRIKMNKTGEVVAVVKAGGTLYSASKQIKVTIGGCGG
ncbi:sulfur oxidation protein SoxY [Achromatium sp. WMS2]|nr:sulfur oxidation protein SoxY [Achromatium sp. WMS2]